MIGPAQTANGQPATQQPAAQQHAVVIAGTPYLGPYAAMTTCINCKQQVATHVHYESGLLTWAIAGGICFFGGCIGCCLIPFCVDSCKDVVHVCPNCHTLIGRYSKL